MFLCADGQRNCQAFIATKAPRHVRFGDGKRIDVAPGKLVSSN